MENEELNTEESNFERNKRPSKTSNHTPAIILTILFGIVVLLLYAGWNLMSDDANNISGMNEKVQTNVDTDLITSETIEVAEAATPLPTPVETETAKETEAPKPIETPKVADTPKPESKTTENTSTYSGKTATYTVKDGDTFFGIANKFNTSASNLTQMNKEVNPEGIKVGVTKITVPVQAVHTVGPGDILRVVATKYGISVEALMAANGKKKNHSERGEKLLIPNKKKV